MSLTNTQCTGCGVGLWRNKDDEDYDQPWCGSCYDVRHSILERRAVVAMIPRLEACVFSCDREHHILRSNLAELREILGMPPVQMEKKRG